MVPNLAPTTWVQPDFSAIVLRIANGDRTAESELVTTLMRGLRVIALRKLDDPVDVDDVVNEVLRIVLENLRSGSLKNPQCLTGYVHAIFVNVARGYLEQRIRARSQQPGDAFADERLPDPQESPELLLQRTERQEFARRVLLSLSARDGEILRRFYLEEQTMREICEDMGLTETQFRLMKSRAKAKFGEIGQRMFKRRAIPQLIDGRAYRKLA